MIDTAAPDVASQTPAPQRYLRRWLAGVVVVAVVVGGAWLVFFSSAFSVRQIDVSGANATLADEVRTAAAVPAGTPLVRLDTSSIAQRVRAVPAVASVSVSVSYPSTVHISVTSRKAVAYTVQGTTRSLYDASGVMFSTTTSVPKGLPRLTQATGDTLTSQDRAAALAVAGSMPTSLLAKVDYMLAPDPNSVTLVTRNGRRVVWGNASAAKQKSTLLEAMIGRDVSYIDLSEPGYVATR